MTEWTTPIVGAVLTVAVISAGTVLAPAAAIKPQVSVIINPVQTTSQSVGGDWRTETLRRQVEKELEKQGAEVVGYYGGSYHELGTYRFVIDLKVKSLMMTAGPPKEEIEVTAKVWYKQKSEGTVTEIYDSFAVWRGGRNTARVVWRQIVSKGIKIIYEDVIEHWRIRHVGEGS